MSKDPHLDRCGSHLATKVEPYLGYLINLSNLAHIGLGRCGRSNLDADQKSPTTLPIGKVNCSERGTYRNDHFPLDNEGYQ